MGTPPGPTPTHQQSDARGARPPDALVALLDTIARADHISREQVVRRALVREAEQHTRRSRRDRQRRPTTCATFDAELEAQLASIVANVKPGRRQLVGGQTLGAHAHETILIPLKAPNESAHDEIARRRLVALLDTIAGEDHISRGHVVKRALVREVEQHIRRALRTLASRDHPSRTGGDRWILQGAGFRGRLELHATLKTAAVGGLTALLLHSDLFAVCRRQQPFTVCVSCHTCRGDSPKWPRRLLLEESAQLLEYDIQTCRFNGADLLENERGMRREQL